MQQVEQRSELVVEVTPEVKLVQSIVKDSVKVQKAKTLVKEFDERVKSLKALIPSDAPVDEVYTFSTEEGEVTFAKPSNQMEITDMEKVFKMLGKELFIQLASIKVGDLKDYLTKKQLDEVTVTRKTGSRNFKSATSREW